MVAAERKDNEIYIIDNTKSAQDEFGHAWGSGHILIGEEAIDALLAGKQIAFCDGEYVNFISMSEPS
jgi:hypothetical protein